MHTKTMLGLLLLLLILIAPGCGSGSIPCGQFTFTGTPNNAIHGISNSVEFAFDPAACSAPPCNCGTICYIQIIRVIDLETAEFRQPFSEQANRMVTGNSDPSLNGWAIDRLMGKVFGHYGRNDDGAFSSSLTPGSNTIHAVLRDAPSGWANKNWFQAVSVPVCIDSGSGCVDRLLGFHYWDFIIDPDGNVSQPTHYDALDWQLNAFDAAVVEWNNDASGLGKNPFPALSRMP